MAKTVMMEVIEQVKFSWQSNEGLQLQAPASKQLLDDFELTSGVKLPVDLRHYFSSVNGFEQTTRHQDSNGFNFWPLEKFSPVSECSVCVVETVNSMGLYVFADYLDLCWAYAIRLSEVNQDNEVMIVGTANGIPQYVAPSFKEFLALYLLDDAKLFPNSQETGVDPNNTVE